MRARLVLLALLVACGADAQHVGDDGLGGSGAMGPYAIGDGFPRSGGPATTVDLDGQVIAFADECTTTKTIYTQAPRIPIVFTRASSAWCIRSDGTMVLLSSNQARRERLGLLIEGSSAGNSLTAPRDLSNAAWTKTSATCTLDATGPDGVSNSASTCEATGASATVTQTVTTAAAVRSTSMRMRRKTGTGAVYVSRNNFSTEVDISASLSATTWKWVRAGCGNASTAQWWDPSFDEVSNCIDVSALTSSVLNPTIGIKIATSGDEVEIDMVQDEARWWGHRSRAVC
jgi:hypothetical protein